MNDEKELTLRALLFSVLIGSLVMVINIYLTAVAGMDINASPLATVLGMFLVPLIGGATCKKELNILQTSASALVYISASLPTTYVAMLMMGDQFRFWPILFVMLLAGLVGVCFVTLFSKQYVNDSKLPFPLSRTCQVALDNVGQMKTGNGKMLLIFIVIGFVISLGMYLDIIPMTVDFSSFLPSGVTFGVLLMPMLIGLGYLCGAKVGLWTLATALLVYFVEGPAGTHFGWFADPAQDISEIQNFNLPVVIGIALVSSLIPLFMQVKSLKGLFRFKKQDRSADDISLRPIWILLAVSSIALIIFCYAAYSISIPQMLLYLVLSLLFTLIGIRVQAESGISACTAMTSFGSILAFTISRDPIIALMVNFIVGTIMVLASDTINDLKTGQYVSASPRKQIKSQFFGVAAGSVMGLVFFTFLLKNFGLDSELYSYPIARMNLALVDGLANGNASAVFNLGRFCIGGVIGGACTFLSLPAGAIAIAVYLAPATSVGVALGGIIRFIVEKAKGEEAAEHWNNAASGFVVGDALVALIFAVIMAV